MFFKQSLIPCLLAGAAVNARPAPVETITLKNGIATTMANTTVTTADTAVASANLQGASTTSLNMSTATNREVTYTPTTMMTVTNSAPAISKRKAVEPWGSIPTAGTGEQDLKMLLGTRQKIEFFGKGFLYTKEDAKKFTKLANKCRIHKWKLVYGDDLPSDFKDNGWDFYAHAMFRGQRDTVCLQEAVTSLGGPGLDLAPVPAWSCRVKYEFFEDRVVIKGLSWDRTLLDRDGVPGKGLHDEIKHCGTFSKWSYEQDVDGWDFVANGITTIWQERCISHALTSAGAPKYAFCH